MLATIRYTKGLGDDAVYARARDAAGHFLVFATGAWIDAEDATCQAALPEVDDSTTESRYQAEVTLPDLTVNAVLEYVLADTGDVLGEEALALNSVVTTPSTGAVATLDDLHQFLADWDDADESILTAILNAASDEIESHCGRKFAADDYNEIYDWDTRGRIVLLNVPLNSVASITRVSDGLAIPAYTQGAESPYYTFDARGWVDIDNTACVLLAGDKLRIQYNANFVTIPADVVSCVAELAATRFRARDRLGVMSRSDPGGVHVAYQVLTEPMSVKGVKDRYKRWTA